MLNDVPEPDVSVVPALPLNEPVEVVEVVFPLFPLVVPE